MRIKLVVEDAKKGEIELSLDREEVAVIYDLPFLLDKDWRVLKLNKIDKPLFSLTKKFQQVEQDIVNCAGYVTEEAQFTIRQLRTR